ncbi:hypothetical protein BT69DRAFT_1317229 [Atractiella rhizophila]|nr:hypothetical protein BT69DRAFT_1317229 [Atractiella rhizophila]
MAPNPFLTTKGVVDVVVGGILMYDARLLYHSNLMMLVNRITGLRLSNPTIAPSFNVALGAMSFGVGCGALRAGMSKTSEAQAVVFTQYASWSTLSILVCLLSPDKYGNASMAFSAFINVCFLATNIGLGMLSWQSLFGVSDGKSAKKEQ